MIFDTAIQGTQMFLVLLLSPLLTGLVRKVKARLVRRQGPPLIQSYRDLARLMRKDAVLAENASWLFRVDTLSHLRRHLGGGVARANLRRGPAL